MQKRTKKYYKNGGSSEEIIFNTHPKINLNKYKFGYHVTNSNLLWELEDFNKDIFLTLSTKKTNMLKLTDEETNYIGYHQTGFMYRKFTYEVDLSKLNIGKLDSLMEEEEKIRKTGLTLNNVYSGRGSIFDRYRGDIKKRIHELYFPNNLESESPSKFTNFDGYFDPVHEILFLKITPNNKDKINNAISIYYVYYTDECYLKLVDEYKLCKDILNSPEITSLTKKEFRDIIKSIRKKEPCLKRYVTTNLGIISKISKMLK